MPSHFPSSIRFSFQFRSIPFPFLVCIIRRTQLSHRGTLKYSDSVRHPSSDSSSSDSLCALRPFISFLFSLSCSFFDSFRGKKTESLSGLHRDTVMIGVDILMCCRDSRARDLYRAVTAKMTVGCLVVVCDIC